jgi:hypothetical protein
MAPPHASSWGGASFREWGIRSSHQLGPFGPEACVDCPSAAPKLNTPPSLTASKTYAKSDLFGKRAGLKTTRPGGGRSGACPLRAPLGMSRPTWRAAADEVGYRT